MAWQTKLFVLLIGIQVFLLTFAQHESDVDECSSRPCLNNGVCRSTNGSFICYCHNRYHGEVCEIDRYSCPQVLCHDHGSCTNVSGVVVCVCSAGFKGQNCETSCDWAHTGLNCNDLDVNVIILIIILLLFLVFCFFMTSWLVSKHCAPPGKRYEMSRLAKT